MITRALGLALALVAAPPALQWTSTTSLPQGVDHHATFVTTGTNGAILHVLGGNNYTQQFGNHWYAPIAQGGAVGEWREAAAFSKPILGHTVLVVGRAAVAIAGQNAGRRNTGEVWTARVGADGMLGEWMAGPALPASRFHHAAVAFGNAIYVLGGLETTSSTRTVFRSRVATSGTLGAWEALDSMPRSRSHEAAFVANGRLYLVGGLDGNPAGQNAPLWDVISAPILPNGDLGPWQVAGALDSAYATHGAFVHGGYVYVAGGVENNARFVGTVQRARLLADGTLGAFEPSAALPQARGHVHHLPVVNGRVYSVGGSRSRQVTTDVFVGRLTP
jgi:hypothetical protein